MQAIGRRIDKLCFDNISIELIGMIFAMPLLPWNKFPDGFTVIQEKVNEFNGIDRTKLNQLLQYIKRNWIKNAKIVSVYDAPYRTNIFVESANRYLKSKCGVRSNLWNVISEY